MIDPRRLDLPTRIVAAVLIVLSLAARTHAADSGSFIVMLGRDTTSIEQYTRTPARLDVHQVGRSPSVLRRHYVYEFKSGAITRLSMVATPPGSTTPTQTTEASFGPDSMRMTSQSGSAPAQNVVLALPANTIVVTNASPWVGYETALVKLVASKKDSLRVPLYFLGGQSTNWLTVSKLGRDSVEIRTDRPDVYRARVDKSGNLVGVLPLVGTAKFTVTRVNRLDLEGMTAGFVAREKAGAGLGTLSPRDTVQAQAAGAAIWIDYSRPSKRGRVVFGGVVPFGEVWRTGANAATQFKTDKSLDFSGTVVPAGFYTLFSIPGPSGWKLIINSETGQPGTARDPAKDVYTIDLAVTALPEVAERFTIAVDPTPQGGVLRLDWDTTRASAPFAVRQ
jgi:Protein of unknown function (DUF2911)